MDKNIISKDDIRKLAELANLDVSGQAEKLSEMLSDTLDYVGTLNELDTSNTVETFQVTGQVNVFQNEGYKGDSLTREESLSNAHEEVNGLFASKAVFDR